jgi:N-methylhydantoinase A
VFFEGRDPGDAGAGRRPGAGARQAAGGNKIAGPAVIEEISATTVLYPGDRAEVHASGVLLVECPA